MIHKHEPIWSKTKYIKMDLALPKGYEQWQMIITCEELYEGRSPL